jgi:hypothetical protein
MDHPNQFGGPLFRQHHHKYVPSTYNTSRVDYECLYDSTRDFSTEHKTLLGICVLTTLDKNHPPSAFPEIGNELSTKNQTAKELSL